MTRGESRNRPEEPFGTAKEAVVVRSEEELALGTRRVPYERVRLVKRIVTETQTITTEVRREELHVERIPLDVAGDAAEDSSRPADLEIVLREERVVLSTAVVPYERVRVSTAIVEEQRRIAEDVAREEIEVERTPLSPG